MTPNPAAKRGRRFDPERFLSTVDSGRTILAVPKKKIIFAQGDPSDAVFYLLKGKVKLTVVSHSGKEATIGILKEGRLLRRGLPDGSTLPNVFGNTYHRLFGDAHRQKVHDGCDSSGACFL